MISMNMSEIRCRNLRKVIDAAVANGTAKNDADFCNQHELSSSYISQMLNGHRPVGEKSARNMEKKIGLVDKTLDAEAPIADSFALPKMIQAQNQGLQGQVQLTPVKYLIQKPRYIPIKGSARMGPDGYFNTPESFAVEDGDGYVQSIAGGPNSYALRGTGGSMFPAIRDGWFVVCEPDTNPVAGEFVLVCINHERCIIKEYITQRDGLLHLLSVNSGERMALEMAEVTAIVPIIEIMPPSRRVLDRPVFDV